MINLNRDGRNEIDNEICERISEMLYEVIIEYTVLLFNEIFKHRIEITTYKEYIEIVVEYQESWMRQ